MWAAARIGLSTLYPEYPGGYRSPGFQVLICVVGEGATLAAWPLKERAGPWRLDPNKAAGVLLCALGVLEGFYRPAPETPESAD